MILHFAHEANVQRLRTGTAAAACEAAACEGSPRAVQHTEGSREGGSFQQPHVVAESIVYFPLAVALLV